MYVNGIYQCEHYGLEELYPQRFFGRNKSKINLWKLWDERILKTFDMLKMTYSPDDPVLINDWLWGGNFQYSGFRPFTCPEGAEFSMHKWFKAGDLKFSNYDVQKIIKDIKKDPFAEPFQYITCIEVGKEITWLHVDSRNWDKEKDGLFIITLK